MNNTTRKRILTAIQKHQLISVSEICLYLDLNPANTRHHLSILKDEGLIEELLLRKRSGRGRPEKIYSISKIFKEDGLENLIVGILQIWRATQTEDDYLQILEELAGQLSRPAGDVRHLAVTKRLTVCVEHLSALHYQARWEASPYGPRIRLSNCPYWKIIKQYPELCRMDEKLIEDLSGIKMKQTSKLERDERGLLECSFVGG